MTRFMEEDSNRKQVRHLAAVFKTFRTEDQDIPVTQALCLMWVALNEGRTQVELRDELGLASSTSSRSLAALSNVHRTGKEGLGLIEWVENPADRRAKLLLFRDPHIQFYEVW